MIEFKEMSKTELHKLIDSNMFNKILIATADLEKRKDCGSKRYNKKEGKELVDKCKTIIAMIDNADDEESLDIYALYTVLQEDILNIKPEGLEHKMLLFPEAKE